MFSLWKRKYVQFLLRNIQNSPFVTIWVAIVWRRKDCQCQWSPVALFLVLKARVLHFMTPNDQFEFVLFQKRFRLPDSIKIWTHSVFIRKPFLENLFHRITPQQIAKSAFFWRFLESVKFLNFIDGFDFGRNSCMDTKIFIVNDGSKGEKIENLDHLKVHLLVVLLQAFDSSRITFFTKVKCGGKNSRFMVTSQKIDSARKFDFHAQKKSNDFKAKLASVNVVPHEKVRGFFYFSELIEDVQKIVKLAVLKRNLPMNVTDDHDGRGYFDDVRKIFWIKSGCTQNSGGWFDNLFHEIRGKTAFLFEFSGNLHDIKIVLSQGLKIEGFGFVTELQFELGARFSRHILFLNRKFSDQSDFSNRITQKVSLMPGQEQTQNF